MVSNKPAPGGAHPQEDTGFRVSALVIRMSGPLLSLVLQLVWKECAIGPRQLEVYKLRRLSHLPQV